MALVPLIRQLISDGLAGVVPHWGKVQSALLSDRELEYRYQYLFPWWLVESELRDWR